MAFRGVPSLARKAGLMPILECPCSDWQAGAWSSTLTRAPRPPRRSLGNRQSQEQERRNPGGVSPEAESVAVAGRCTAREAIGQGWATRRLVDWLPAPENGERNRNGHGPVAVWQQVRDHSEYLREPALRLRPLRFLRPSALTIRTHGLPESPFKALPHGGRIGRMPPHGRLVRLLQGTSVALSNAGSLWPEGRE